MEYILHLKPVRCFIFITLLSNWICPNVEGSTLLNVAVFQTKTSANSTTETEMLKIKSAWGQEYSIISTVFYTDIHTPFVLVETVSTMINNTDIIIVSDVLCSSWSFQEIFSTTKTPVLCVTEVIKKQPNIQNVNPPDIDSVTVVTNQQSDPTGTSLGYNHLFSDLDISEEDIKKLSSVLVDLRWSTIMILYDDSTAFAAKIISSHLEDRGTQAFMYNVGHNLDTGQLHNILRSGYDEMLDNKRNFLVLCSTQCAASVVTQAEAFDDLNEGNTALHYFSTWLVVTQSPHLCDRTHIQMTINNMAFIYLPGPTSTKALKSKVRTYLKEVLDIFGNSEKPNTTLSDQRSDILYLTQEVIKQREQQVGSVLTLLWKDHGRELAHVGSINKTNHVNMYSYMFPNSRMGFNKKRFKIGTLPWYPYIIRETDKGKSAYVGYCIDLLEELAVSLNFSYEWKEPDDGEWGRIMNKSWTGLVGQIQDKEVEMLVAPLGISSDREEIMDFIFPFIYDYTAVLYKTPYPNRNKWRQLVDPFKWQVLLCIGISLFSMGMIVWGFEKINPFYDAISSRKSLPRRKNFEDTFLYVYGCLLTQGGSHIPTSASGRVLIAFWWLFSIVVAATYSGNLIAFLTVNKDKPPFETLEELTAQREYKWGTLGGSIWVQRFQTSNRSEFRGLWTGIQEFLASDKDVLSLDQQVHLDKVDQGGYGFIADKSAMEISTSSKCNLQFLKEVFYPIHYAIALPNNSPYFKLFSDEMLKVHESGLLQIWKRRWWPRQSMCKGSLLSETKTIQLIDLQSAFYVVGIGIFGATCSVLIEAYLTPRGRQRRQEKKDIQPEIQQEAG